MQDGPLGLLGAAFIGDAQGANAFTKLSRYETTLDGVLMRSLMQLERLQQARSSASTSSPPPGLRVLESEPAEAVSATRETDTSENLN